MYYEMEAVFYGDDEAERYEAEFQARRAELRAAEEAERSRREKVWATRHPNEWEEWRRVRLLMNPIIDFCAEHPFDFEDFLKEVGRRETLNHFVERLDTSKPYQQGNMKFEEKGPERPASPYYTAKEAAAYCRLGLQTIYNHSHEIRRVPGIGKLLYTQEALDEWLTTRRKKSQPKALKAARSRP